MEREYGGFVVVLGNHGAVILTDVPFTELFVGNVGPFGLNVVVKLNSRLIFNRFSINQDDIIFNL